MDALPAAVGTGGVDRGGVDSTRLRSINASAPAALAARAQRARLVGERKPVTAVFADIVGSTALAERLDAEEWAEILNAAFDEMSRCIFDYEGTIAQVLGDAIVSFFGAPVAHEDDPERAVRAALALTDAMRTYGENVRRTRGIDFRIRVGISTGPVLVGQVGSDLRYDYTAIGDTMNLASRLQGAAEPGGVLISDRTARFVEPLFELEDAGELDLKGKAEPVRAFRVVRPKAEPGATRGLAGLHSPMVGRDVELATLIGLARTTRAGRGRVALVIAEAGLGKSRLLAEARAAIAREESTTAAAEAPEGATPIAFESIRETAWVTGRASSFGGHRPFHVITSLLLDILGMTPESPPADIDTALQLLLAELGLDPDDAYRYLAYLMGLPLEPLQQADVARISADLLASRIAGSLLQLLKGVAAQGPLVVVIEDIHWADAASVEMTAALLTVADEAPVLIICTTRDEPAAPGWGVVTAVRERVGRALTELRLEPLDRDRSSDLVAGLLEIESLAPATRELILGKAEGNPYFVEEIIRMLIDRGAIERRGDRWVASGAVGEVQIPDTLQGLILARIDRLPDHARRLLRMASCIDRQFAVPLLEDVARAGGDEGGIGDALGRLEAADLLVLVATDPELEVRFSHALVQDAAYESVLRQERREWHLRIAAALQARYPDREAELADRLAHHYEQGGDHLRAVRFLLTAADRALARGATTDARTLYEHAHELLPADDVDAAAILDGGTADDITRLRVRIALGRVGAGAYFLWPGDALAIVAEAREPAERLAESPADRDALASLLHWEVHYREAQGERPGSSPDLDAALERRAEVGEPVDETHLSLMLFEISRLQTLRGEFAASLATLERATAGMRRRGDAIGASMAEFHLASNLASMGDFAAADAHLAVAYDLASGGDRLALVDYQLARAEVAAIRGDFASTEEEARACFLSSTELGALPCITVSSILLGSAHVAQREGADAEQALARGIELTSQGIMPPLHARATMFLASAHALLGDAVTSEAEFESAIGALTADGNRYGLAEAQFHHGLMVADRPAGDLEVALRWLESARALFEEIGARPDLARADRARGQVLARLGRTDEADAALAASAALAAEMGLLDGPWPTTAEEALEAAAG